MPERLEEIEVDELSLVPKGAHPGTDFVPLAKEGEETPAEEPLEKEEPAEEPEVTSPADLAKEFVSRLSEMPDDSVASVVNAILGKSYPDEEDEEEEVEDPLSKRLDAMEKTIAGLTGGLMKSAESIEKLVENMHKEPEPEPEPEDPELEKALAKIAKNLSSFEAQHRSTQAKAKIAFGEDPGDTE